MVFKQAMSVAISLGMLSFPMSSLAGTCDGATYTCPSTANASQMATSLCNFAGDSSATITSVTSAGSTQGPEYDNSCCIGGIQKICHDYDVTCLYNVTGKCMPSGNAFSASGSNWTGSTPSPKGTTSTGCVTKYDSSGHTIPCGG
jgi:hypothetical protein